MLTSISPLDGRYADKTVALQEYFSEFALIRERVSIEIKYLIALDDMKIFPKLSNSVKEELNKVLHNFSLHDAEKIKEIEKNTQHDVKSCEIYLRSVLHNAPSSAWHWGLTSEDINNLAWSRLLLNFKQNYQVPELKKLIFKITDMAEQSAQESFPARTHGQLASPTTAGKELAVFLQRLYKLYNKLCEASFTGKLNGATGNYSAMYIASPENNWIYFSAKFIRSLGLDPSFATTQVESHGSWVEYFDLTKHINNVINDLNSDFWQYLMLGYYQEKHVGNEVGSSTMPHKINPIRFENSEGNICIANALLQAFSNKLPISRLQRDLSDSTVCRNIGVALAHSMLAWNSTFEGLQRIELNPFKCNAELNSHPEIIAEAVQSVLRVFGVENAYEILREKSQGKVFSSTDLQQLLDNYSLPPAIKQELINLSPTKYTGKAEYLCNNITTNIRREMQT